MNDDTKRTLLLATSRLKSTIASWINDITIEVPHLFQMWGVRRNLNLATVTPASASTNWAQARQHIRDLKCVLLRPPWFRRFFDPIDGRRIYPFCGEWVGACQVLYFDPYLICVPSRCRCHCGGLKGDSVLKPDARRGNLKLYKFPFNCYIQGMTVGYHDGHMAITRTCVSPNNVRDLEDQRPILCVFT